MTGGNLAKRSVGVDESVKGLALFGMNLVSVALITFYSSTPKRAAALEVVLTLLWLTTRLRRFWTTLVSMTNQPPYITDLDQIALLAQARADNFDVMCYMLQDSDRVDDAALDAVVIEQITPILAAIDCTQCANCCRSLTVYLTPNDADRLLPVIDVPLSAILDHESAALVDEWAVFRQRPCAFLREQLCGIYPHRPTTCREYPVVTPDFRWLLSDLIEGASICPILYNLLNRVEAMVDQGVIRT